MRKRFYIKPWMVITGFILLFAITIGVTYLAERSKSGAELTAGSAVSATENASAGFGYKLKSFFQRIFGTRDVDKEYQSLKSKVIELETELSRMDEIESENTRLNELLGFKQNVSEYEYIPARVISRDPGSWYFTFNIDKGSKQGVSIDMSVVSEDGLVGRITEVGANWSKVLCLIDRTSSVPALVERTRDQGIIKGATDANSEKTVCNVYYLNPNSELVPGDLLLTSNLGGVFPKGIPVGRVQEVSRDATNTNYAVITPLVDFMRLENVMVIKGERPSDYEAKDDASNTSKPQTTPSEPILTPAGTEPQQSATPAPTSTGNE